MLASNSNRLGQQPIMTLGIVLSVADGARILSDEFRRTIAEPGRAGLRQSSGDRARYGTGVFAAALHGEEHYWPPALLAAARTVPRIATWVSSSAIPKTETLPASLQSRWIDGTELPSKPLHADNIKTAALAEVASFRMVFGHGPKVAVPPTFIWNHAVEAAWAEAGIQVVVTPGRRYEARDAEGEPIAIGPAILNGHTTAAGMTCMVRDDYFEPARGHTAERGLTALGRKTHFGRPTLLETHRVNFMGDAAVAEVAIRELDRLFVLALERFPEVMFLSTRHLPCGCVDMTVTCGTESGSQAHVWLQRLWELRGCASWPG